MLSILVLLQSLDNAAIQNSLQRLCFSRCVLYRNGSRSVQLISWRPDAEISLIDRARSAAQFRNHKAHSWQGASVSEFDMGEVRLNHLSDLNIIAASNRIVIYSLMHPSEILHIMWLLSTERSMITKSNSNRVSNKNIQLEKLYVNELGWIITPATLAIRYGFAPWSRIVVDQEENALRLHRTTNRLAKLYIEPTNACNLHCRTCIRNSWDEPTGMMSEETFSHVISTAFLRSPRGQVSSSAGSGSRSSTRR